MSKLESSLELQLKAEKITGYEREYKFHEKRRWRFDFAFPEQMLAIECEGGVYSNGRHTRGKGFEQDCEKYNAAVMMGWHILRFTAKHINDLSALNMIISFIGK